MATETFDFTGDWVKWNVPTGVKIVEVVVKGAGSGSNQGGKVTGKMRVDDDKALWILVGRAAHLHDGREGGEPCFGGGGAGGRGSSGLQGGNGGGGASAIRIGSKDGPIRAVAGGAGGNSGDGGDGGSGGADTGGPGGPGGSGAHGDATGGTQNQSGRGGSSGAGSGYDGKNGQNQKLGRGGEGGGPSNPNTEGGGGGGGGYYPGGGGQAAKVGSYPGGGGSGGSNFVGGIYNYENIRGTGGTGNGQVKITYDIPGGNDAPTPATDITIDGNPITSESVSNANALATRSMGAITVRGLPHDPDDGQGLRMLVRLSKTSGFASYKEYLGTFDTGEHRDKVHIIGLDRNTLWHMRVYTQDQFKKVSNNFTGGKFWTNRPPSAPTLLQPAENVQITTLVNLTFTWNHADPDSGHGGPGAGEDNQTAFRLRHRKAATPIDDAGEWSTIIEQVTGSETWTIGSGVFKGNTFYEWEVKTRDEQGVWGEWAFPKSFYVTAPATPPVLIDPINRHAIVADDDYKFRWKFLGPQKQVAQSRADLRYRVYSRAGDLPWVTMLGDVTTPGKDPFWVIPGETFAVGVRYDWQVRTYNTANFTSEWSEPGAFWAVAAPGSGPGIIVVESGRPHDPIGVGNNRVFVYDRGGQTIRGEITPLIDVLWNRKRDDISGALLHIAEWDGDMRTFLGSLRTWMHEIVIFRESGNGDMERVFEGPITRIAATKGGVEIEAKDVMAYVYRRIMRQGYNDSYRIINGEQVGQHTVVERAQQIIMNAMAYDDPNILAYLAPLNHSTDARQSRVVKDFSKTAWEEVDDLAAHAGLDYVTSGRRILLWDTHQPIGRLPEMRDGDFSDPPVVTEYGMSMANVFAVTNNNGVWGIADKLDEDDMPGPEGFIEQLASSYGESEGGANGASLTRKARTDLVRNLNAQARRNIAGRYPAPLVVRVPDNTQINPDLNIGINQLIPGVWIPLRIEETVRTVSQWQKLDSVQVTQDANGEKIAVVMSPAPNGGADPDLDEALEAEA